MKKIFIAVLSVLVLITCSPKEEDMFDLIISRIQNENENNTMRNIDEAVRNSLELFTDEGYFTDVDYAFTAPNGAWQAFRHVTRLYDFVFAYTLPNSAYFENERLYDTIIAGLERWAVQPESTHWWHNQIADPQRLGVMLIQMRKGEKQLPAELEQKILERMTRNAGEPEKWTGGNKTDMALHWLYRACLTRDEALLEQAVNFAWEPVALSDDEGIQHDYSYFQHGHQIYMIGYGSEFINGITLFAQYTVRTPYALSEEKLEIFSRFFRESFLPVIRGQYSLFTVGGRGMSRPWGTNQGPAFLRKMQFVDPAHSDFYDIAIQRISGEQPASYGITSSHRHYPVGEYTLHTRPGHVFDVRMASKRTARLEYGNMENLKVYYASDGSTNIMQRGDEYAGIFPVWNWTRVPGITCAQVDSISRPPNQWEVRGTADFAGGVSDSMYGVTAYSYDAGYTGNSAKKAWFFFDDEMVCLGSGISAGDSVSAYDVNTTLNQCLLNGEITVSSRGNAAVVSPGEHVYAEAPDWVLHDGIGYFFPQGGAVGLSGKAQSGSWREINANQSDEPVTKDVFTLWLNHGKKPVNARYAYIVAAGMNSAEAMEAYRQNAAVSIMANNKTVQAVYHKGLDILGIVFYEAGIFEHNGISVETDKACAILFRNISGKKAAMYIADPAKTKSRIALTVCFPAVSPEHKKIICDFTETGIFAGGMKMYEIED